MKWKHLVTALAVILLLTSPFVYLGADSAINYEDEPITPDAVTAGTRPARSSGPKTRHHPKGRALAYRLSSGRTVTSTFALPRMGHVWFDGVFRAEHKYINGFLDFVPDRNCASGARVAWRLGGERGRLRLADEVVFNHLEVGPDSVVLTAQLAAPAPCAGTLRFTRAQAVNNPDSGSPRGTERNQQVRTDRK